MFRQLVLEDDHSDFRDRNMAKESASDSFPGGIEVIGRCI